MATPAPTRPSTGRRGTGGWLKRDPIKIYRERLAQFGVGQDAVAADRGGGQRGSRRGNGGLQGGADADRRHPPHRCLCRWRLVMAELTYREAVARGIAQEMARDPDVVFLGEDVGAAGGVFKAAGSLHLFDLGYFKQDHLAMLRQQEAFYVTRYQSQTAIYSDQTGEPIDVLKWLRATHTQDTEMNVTLGARIHTPLRLIVHRLPRKVAAARRRKAKRKALNDGKTCSAAYLALQG